ncbi:MAG: hypothetical protein K8W52_03990 [Deltaproteobacteria bacterium]|nr:hypothetical protein [Deltaproteobacteria bacterium]
MARGLLLMVGLLLLVVLLGPARVAHAAPKAPTHVELIAGKLAVDIYAHDIATQHGALPVWTFVSTGLASQHQAEVRITVKREPNEKVDAYPRDLLDLYRAIYRQAAKGSPLTAGQWLEVPPGLLGRADFQGVVFVPQVPFLEVPSSAGSLTGLIVTKNEAASTETFGLTRLMARLGQAEQFYPTTPWADRKRAELVGPDGNDGSLLAKVPSMRFDAGEVIGGADGRITLSLLPGARALFKQIFAAKPDGGFALLLPIADNADSCLVWEPGQHDAAAIVGPGSTGQRRAGNYVMLVAGKDAYVSLIEDGFGLVFPPAAWAKVRAALEQGTPLTLRDPSFTIEWLETDYTDPVTGAVEHAPGGFRTFVPKTPTPDTGPIIREQIVLLTDNAEFASRVTAEDLAAFLERVDAAIRAERAALPAKARAELVVDFNGDASTRKGLRLVIKPAISKAFAARVQKRLDALVPPAIHGGTIHVQAHYRLDGAAH